MPVVGVRSATAAPTAATVAAAQPATCDHRVPIPGIAGARARGGRRMMPGWSGGLRGRDAEFFGVGPAVVLGQDRAEIAGPVRHGGLADLAAGDRKIGDGNREAAGT
jgi:hypothetical protein